MAKEIKMNCNCPIEAVMNIIGGKYKTIIIWHLVDTTLRFNQLQKAIPQATPKMLSLQLKELEAHGIVNRVLYPVVPPKTEYSLTELGTTLVPIVQSLCQWGKDYYEHFGLPFPVTDSD